MNSKIAMLVGKIKSIHTKFDALMQREKVMVAGLLVVVLGVTWQIVLFDNADISETKLKSQIKTQQNKNSSIKIEIASYKERELNNPNVKLEKDLVRYLKQIRILDDKLNNKMKGLINPKKMTTMLKDIFKSNTQLTLLSLEKLKTKSILDEKNQFGIELDTNATKSNQRDEVNGLNVTDNVQSQSTNSSAAVYRHAVKIVFTGSYLSTLNYLEAIENMPWDLYWDKVQLDVEKYPRSKIIITVFTLSLKKGWIGV